VTSKLPQDTALVLGALARQLATDRSVEATLAAIVDSAARTLQDVAAVGISYLEGPHTVLARAQSDQLVTDVDDLQTALQEGPCLRVLTGASDMVRSDDLRTDGRFPRFAQAAVERGVLSVLAFRLFVEKTTLGNLSLFATEANAFDESAELIGELFATHAAVALSGVRLEEQFNQAVRRRDVIGQAKGVLMARHDLDEETAFATLVRYSQSEHVKLYDVALQLLESLRADRRSADNGAVASTGKAR
jgi:transcriptional regulator with GAF, ATPase, and Fis domain